MLKKMMSFLLMCLLTVSIATFANTSLHASLPTPNITPQQPLDGIVAVVNNEIITRSQFNHALMVTRQQFMQRHIPIPADAAFKKQVLDELIYQKLQLQLAKRNNISATAKEVDAAIGRIAKQNHLTVAQMKKSLTQQGITYKKFHAQIKRQITITKLQHAALAAEVKIKPAEIAAFRKQHAAKINPTQYHVATIVIPLPDSPTAAQVKHAHQKALHVLKQARGKTGFQAEMDKYSSSTDLGWRTLNDLPQIFVSQVKKMKSGQIAGPIKAPNGFHVIKLLGKRVKQNVSDKQIQQMLFQQKFRKALKKWLLKLRQSAYVHIYKSK